MPFDPNALTPVNVTNEAWALNMVRMILRDTRLPERFTDDEIAVQLDLHAFRPNGATYYRPHVTAAAMVTTDPDRAISEGIDNANETRESPRVIGIRIVREYAMLDRRIAAESGEHPDPPQGEARVLF